MEKQQSKLEHWIKTPITARMLIIGNPYSLDAFYYYPRQVNLAIGYWL